MVSRQSAINLLKGLEQFFHVLWVDADARVVNTGHNRSPINPAINAHLPALRELHRIVDQIEQNLLDPALVAHHRANRGRNTGVKRQSFF